METGNLESSLRVETSAQGSGVKCLEVNVAAVSPRAPETVATLELRVSLFLCLGLWPCAVPWCSPVALCGVWREKKESDVHLGVRVKQVSFLGLTQWRCS